MGVGYWCYQWNYHEIALHDDVIKWKHFLRYWPFVRGIHRSLVNSPHKGQWRGALMFSLICACINGWVNNCKAGNLGRHCTHYDIIVMALLDDVMTWKLFPNLLIESLMDSAHKGSAMWMLFIFIVRLNKLLNKLLGCQWFDTPWCACDIILIPILHDISWSMKCYM